MAEQGRLVQDSVHLAHRNQSCCTCNLQFFRIDPTGYMQRRLDKQDATFGTKMRGDFTKEFRFVRHFVNHVKEKNKIHHARKRAGPATMQGNTRHHPAPFQLGRNDVQHPLLDIRRHNMPRSPNQ